MRVTATSARPTGATDAMSSHLPVMLDEALAGLNLRADGRYVDATFGRGGHSAAILAQLGPDGVLDVFDQDPAAIAHARAGFADDPRVRVHHANFAALSARLAGGKPVDGILMDLGVSSPQLDEAARGFSFSHDGPLDMRMNPGAGPSAADWLARADAEEIANVLWQYGEERNSRRIARRVVETRAAEPITSTAALAKLVAGVPGPRSRSIHPATRTFQAIRIHINQELAVLEQALPQALNLLAPGGRLVVIAFHSLEDRIVKRYLRAQARLEQPIIRVLRKQFPQPEEAARNPRSRSAVLRTAERLP